MDLWRGTGWNLMLPMALETWNDLTTAGNPQWLNLNGQGYVDLDGNGDFFFNNDPSFPVLNEIFVSCWVRIDAFKPAEAGPI